MADRSLDVAVVGAGVVGLAIARELRGRGVRVAVFERSGIGAGASGVQPGGVRQQWGTPVACRLARESAAFYAEADEWLEAPVPLGIKLPIEPEDRFLFLSEPVRERLLEPLVVSAERRFAAKQLGDGRVLTSDLGARGDESQRETWRANVRSGIEELLPALAYVS